MQLDGGVVVLAHDSAHKAVILCRPDRVRHHLLSIAEAPKFSKHFDKNQGEKSHAGRDQQRRGRGGRLRGRGGHQEGLTLGWCCHTSALFKTSLHELGVQFRLEGIGRAKGCDQLIDARGIARKDL